MAIGFWMNNKNCYGCKTCSIACKSEKQLDKGVLLRHVTAIRQDDPRAFAYLSMACNHCEEPACMANCPVGAYSKLEDGTVIQDHSVCIGCKTCISACPYGAPSYDEATSTTFKCDGCYDRRQRGELPACVVAPAQIWLSMIWSLCRARIRPISCPTRTPAPSPTSSSRWMRPWLKSPTTPWSRTARRNFP